VEALPEFGWDGLDRGQLPGGNDHPPERLDILYARRTVTQVTVHMLDGLGVEILLEIGGEEVENLTAGSQTRRITLVVFTLSDWGRAPSDSPFCRLPGPASSNRVCLTVEVIRQLLAQQ